MENKLNEIIETMEDYLELVGNDCGYNKKAIKKFNKISMKYLKKVNHCQTLNKFIDISIEYIKKLNILNDKYNNELIETDQRELIVSMIFEAADQQNIDIDIDEDFTLEYREW